MNFRHTGIRVVRPTLVIVGILGLAYLAGGAGFFTPKSFFGFALAAIVVGLSILLFLSAIYSQEHRHLDINARVRRKTLAAGFRHSDRKRHPPAPSDLLPVSAVPPGLPYGPGTRADTPDNVFSFTRRVFRNRDATHERDR
jgi:hypothetical protein